MVCLSAEHSVSTPCSGLKHFRSEECLSTNKWIQRSGQGGGCGWLPGSCEEPKAVRAAKDLASTICCAWLLWAVHLKYETQACGMCAVTKPTTEWSEIARVSCMILISVTLTRSFTDGVTCKNDFHSTREICFVETKSIIIIYYNLKKIISTPTPNC